MIRSVTRNPRSDKAKELSERGAEVVQADIDDLERVERDVTPVSAEVEERKVVTKLPDITLKELLLAFKDAMERSDMFAHHHVQRVEVLDLARDVHLMPHPGAGPAVSIAGE